MKTKKEQVIETLESYAKNTNVFVEDDAIDAIDVITQLITENKELNTKRNNTSEILKERENTHGDFAEVARTACIIKKLQKKQPCWEIPNFVQREAYEMIAAKLARIVCGDSTHIDHWRDIAGYAQLVVNELEEK